LRTRAIGWAAPSSHCRISAFFAGVGFPFDVAGPVEVGQDAADRGHGEAELGGEAAHRERPVAQVFERGHVARTKRGDRLGRGAVLGPPHAPGDARQHLHEPQAHRAVLCGVRLRGHGPPLTL